jgi:hypothetical protein
LVLDSRSDVNIGIITGGDIRGVLPVTFLVEKRRKGL